MLLPPEYVKEKFLKPAGLSDHLLDQIPVTCWGGERNHLPLYETDEVRAFVEGHRPKQSVGESYKEEGVEMVTTQQGGSDRGPLLKTSEAAKYLAISERQVQYEVQRGRLAVVRLGRSTRFTTADLEEFVGRCRHDGERA